MTRYVLALTLLVTAATGQVTLTTTTVGSYTRPTQKPHSRPNPEGTWMMAAFNPEVNEWKDTRINAADTAFWLMRNTSSYCPPNVASIDCRQYPGNETILQDIDYANNRTLWLLAAVPGGQQGK